MGQRDDHVDRRADERGEQRGRLLGQRNGALRQAGKGQAGGAFDRIGADWAQSVDARAGRIDSHYVRPKRWHCIFCGFRCDDTNNDYLCMRCDALRPFAGGCATVARCNACGGYSLAVARFCEWCGDQFSPLQ